MSDGERERFRWQLYEAYVYEKIFGKCTCIITDRRIIVESHSGEFAQVLLSDITSIKVHSEDLCTDEYRGEYGQYDCVILYTRIDPGARSVILSLGSAGYSEQKVTRTRQLASQIGQAMRGFIV